GGTVSSGLIEKGNDLIVVRKAERWVDALDKSRSSASDQTSNEIHQSRGKDQDGALRLGVLSASCPVILTCFVNRNSIPEFFRVSCR
ncbi:MAG TPA: hypothetical protein VNN73_05395, partial [Blastocatellia bacterium]|nr:hypothetical protein [Blastocatellia bacterium]